MLTRTNKTTGAKIFVFMAASPCHQGRAAIDRQRDHPSIDSDPDNAVVALRWHGDGPLEEPSPCCRSQGARIHTAVGERLDVAHTDADQPWQVRTCFDYRFAR